MIPNLHLGYLVSHYPHKAFGHDGGIGTSVYTLVEKLRQSNITVSVFVYGQKQDFLIEEKNLTIYSIQDSNVKFFKFYFNRKKIEKFVTSIILQKKIQCLEVPDWTGITAFMNFKIPVIIRLHGSDAYFCYLENRKQKFKNFWFEKLALKNAKAYIAPTNFAGEVSKKIFKIREKKITTIYSGLDLQNFKNDSPLIFEKGLILYVGTLIRKKGVLELPIIFNKVRKEYPDAKLVLIGSDAHDIKTNSVSTWKLMQDKFIDNDLKQVSYLGKLPYVEVQEYIKKANVCVFPTFAETLGMVTIESMAMQKAVVNSNIGWSQELIIDGKSGFLVHPENHDLYAERIIQLLRDNLLCSKIGEQALLRTKEKFDINKLVNDNIALYKHIISQEQK
ncbi:glycosyltransferase family 4 protein [Flavobacterium ginsengiterrae]|uniref:Glycosyltransferase family 4 protein n=1 Tax=Flavobacterium ginsengiterrae TaxID=871695 RepID=A0ABP7H0W5_9FLAO